MTQRTAVVVGGASGYSALGLITELPAEDFRSVVDVDLNGGAHMMRYPDLVGHVRRLAAQ
ncbi:MAG: hypothetical protein WCC28_24595 [Mycobacterium sp.]|uniref:hypothetical protein n=1 Tax=Mycobacterium sp. TaxID=1785 RepID=UPI003C73B1D6